MKHYSTAYLPLDTHSLMKQHILSLHKNVQDKVELIISFSPNSNNKRETI